MTQFKDMDLKPEIQKSLEDIGFITSTPIQAKIIPHILNNAGDIIGLAQTGTGKTAAFGLPVLQMMDVNNSRTQALVMAPTRELTMQIATDLKAYGKHIDRLRIVTAYGGARIDTQIKELAKGAHIIVATPGRLLDLIKRRKIDISSIDILVLDEADEMLNFGFKDEIDAILEKAPLQKTTLLFSATMSREIAKIAGDYMRDPIEIAVGHKNIGAENIEYQYYVVNAKNRYIAMRRIIDFHPDIFGIVFCRTRQETKDVTEKLIKDGYKADAIHGDLSQGQRDQVMKRFKNKGLDILVATDVAARGIDVKDITHVINYNLPNEAEIYTHRSGRTGRAGKEGVAVAIIHGKERYRIQKIQRVVGRDFTYRRVPTYEDIVQTRLEYFVSSLKQTVRPNVVSQSVLEKVVQDLSELSKEALIERLIEIQMSPLKQSGSGSHDLNIPFQEIPNLSRIKKKFTESKNSQANSSHQPPKLESRRDNRKQVKQAGDIKNKEQPNSKKKKQPSEINKLAKLDPREINPGMCRFFINSGTKFGLTEETLNQFINQQTNSKISKIESIEIMKKFSFFEVDAGHTDIIISKLNNTTLGARDITVEIAIPPKN